MNKKLPVRSLRLWQIRFSLIFLLIIGVAVGSIRFARWMLVPSALLIVAATCFLFLFLPKWFAGFALSVDSESIVISYGVFFRTTQIMPFPRLVFIRSFATPISKRIGLCGLLLKAARSFIFIPELDIEDARQILSLLSGGSKK